MITYYHQYVALILWLHAQYQQSIRLLLTIPISFSYSVISLDAASQQDWYAFLALKVARAFLDALVAALMVSLPRSPSMGIGNYEVLRELRAHRRIVFVVALDVFAFLRFLCRDVYLLSFPALVRPWEAAVRASLSKGQARLLKAVRVTCHDEIVSMTIAFEVLNRPYKTRHKATPLF